VRTVGHELEKEWAGDLACWERILGSVAVRGRGLIGSLTRSPSSNSRRGRFTSGGEGDGEKPEVRIEVDLRTPHTPRNIQSQTSAQVTLQLLVLTVRPVQAH